MASHKSAEKRNRQTPKRTLRNRVAAGAMRTALKKARTALDTKAKDAPTLVKLAIQQIDKFRMLVIQGFQVAGEGGGTDKHLFLCRDAKNNVIRISLDELNGEISRLDACRERLLAL